MPLCDLSMKEYLALFSSVCGRESKKTQPSQISTYVFQFLLGQLYYESILLGQLYYELILPEHGKRINSTPVPDS